MTPVLFIQLYARAALACTKKKSEKKCSLRNEKVKANRASETEEQRKERLRIRREKDRARRRTKKLQEEKKRLSETKDHKKHSNLVRYGVRRARYELARPVMGTIFLVQQSLRIRW